MSGGRVTIRHMPALDGLRGLAVAGVLLFHGDHLTGGYLGVDLFFVLSGFLITSLLLTESGSQGSVGLGGFWARRARRLLPALAGLLVGVALYCLLIADASELARIRGDGLATLGYVANWRSIVNGQDYWALFRSPSPLEHTWSLAIEEQFYVVWPLLFVGILAIFRAATAKAVLVTALVLTGMSTVLMFVLYDAEDVSRVYYGTDTRAAALFLGIALAAWLSIWGPVRSRLGRVALEGVGLLGIAVLAYAWITVDGDSPRLYQGGFLVLGLATIAIIAAAAHPEAGPISRAFGWRPLCLLGLISYGAYLWHWPIYIVLDTPRTGLDGWALFALRVSVTIIIAVASYLLLELPIRRGALKPVQWRVLTPIAAAALVVVIVITTAAAGPSSVAVADGNDAPVAGRPVLVVGDSVAGTVVPGLRNAGINAIDGSRYGCHLVRAEVKFEKPLGSCPWPTMWNRMVKQEQPALVLVISGGWDLFDVKPLGTSKWIEPGSKEWEDFYEATLEKAVGVLSSRGAHVVIPTIPYFGASGLFGPRPETAESSFNPGRVRVANAVLERVQRKMGDRLSTPDLNRLLSPRGVYQRALATTGGGTIDPVRGDGIHFTGQGSDFVGRWFADHFEPWVTPAEPERDATAGSSRAR